MRRFRFHSLLTVLFVLLPLNGLTPVSLAQPSPPMPAPEVQTLLDKADAASKEVKYEVAMRVLNEALEKAHTLKDQVGEATALRKLGNVSLSTRQTQQALEFYERALSLCRAIGDKSGEANTLSNVGVVYSSIGQPAKALEYYETALRLFQQAGNRQSEARLLYQIGVVYSNTGRMQQALEFFQKALPLYQALGNRNDEAAILTTIGVTFYNAGQPQKALEAWRQVLPLYQAMGNQSGEAGTLTNIGNAYADLGQPQKALDLYQQALPMHRQTGNRGFEAITLGQLGRLYRSLGQPQKALESCESALSLHRALGDKMGEATTLTNIGNLYSDMGQNEKALEFFQQALPLHHQTGNREFEASTINDIGRVCKAMGQAMKALEFYQQVLVLYRAMENKQGEADSLTNIGVVYFETGQPQKALAFWQQALTLCQATGNKNSEAGAITNIGNVYRSIGQQQKALEYYEKALQLHRQTGNRQFEAITLNNIGDVYGNMGQPQKALENHVKALAINRGLKEKYGEASTLLSIGLLYTDTGQPQKALMFFRQALVIYQASGDKPGEAFTLAGLGEAEQKLHRSHNARIHLDQAVALLERLREGLGGYSEAKTSFLAQNLPIYYMYLNALLDSGQTQQAFTLAQKTKARSLLDLLASGRVDLSSALTPEERKQEQELRQQADFLNTQMVKEGVENQVGAKTRFAAYQEELRKVEGRLQTLTDTLYAHHPGLADKRMAKTVTPAEVGAFLPEAMALLEYLQVAPDRVLLFVVTTTGGKAQVKAYPIVIRDAKFQQQCAALHAACADPRKSYQQSARDLYRLLVQPAGKQIAGKTHLVVCPDGPLWEVPFQALLASKKGSKDTFLWEKFGLTYAYSATGAQAAFSARQTRPTMPAGSVLVFANPDFGTTKRFGDLDDLPGQRPFDLPSRPFDLPSRPFDLPSRPFSLPSREMASLGEARGRIASLPGTQREAEAIKHIFPSASVFTGTNAQEATAKSEASTYRYLHFATHGFFNDASPLLSSIVLAQPTKESGEDGFLTAREIFSLQLNADLVTLSACNSGRGVTRSGEGIIGLTWALFVAGCPTQVVSGWSVDDAATATLMASFYGNLKAGKEKGESLREAALFLRRSGGGKYRHPYYWAPFFLIGAWK